MCYEGVGEGRIVVHFCAFLILQHLIPGLKAYVFYKLVVSLGGSSSGVLRNVNYGPVGWTQHQEVEWRWIANHYSGFDDDPEIKDMCPGGREWWLKLLTQEDKSDEEILDDAWMGCGNMWVFKHPGVFPIADAVRLAESCPRIAFTTLYTDNEGRSKVPKATPLLTLPPELMAIVFVYLSPTNMLRFISATKVLYGRYRTQLDRFTCIWIRQERPWYLPVGPIECKEGDTEIVRWRDDWEELTTRSGRGSEDKEIPWFAYYLACQRSPNMWSRERIWDIVLKIKENLASLPV